MDSNVRETVTIILKRIVVLIVSSISIEIMFPYVDYMLNIFRFGEPSLDYERVIELFIFYFIHFIYVNKLFGLEFESQNFSLYYFGAGVCRYLYYSYVRVYVKHAQAVAWSTATEIWKYCIDIQKRTISMIGVLVAALTIMILLRIDKKRTDRRMPIRIPEMKVEPSI